ncbi:hypothetical protein [Sphingomonas endolithica]|uniref:hypothetical protein n=1 Tax=Sphingomonas endolithica TaxID=2972485 RepID=UPI0021AFD0FE|nr:hypothetical protein [Sphingomonas sp. ZFBP2030]
MSEKNDAPSPDVEFSLSRSDLEETAGGHSNTIPNVTFFGKTAFTIENAPIPKSIRDSVGLEKTITVQLKVKLDKSRD